jgi:hypothetical protein
MVNALFAFASSSFGSKPVVAAPCGAVTVRAAEPPLPLAVALAPAEAEAAADAGADAGGDAAADAAADAAGLPGAPPDAAADADAAGAYVHPGAAPDEHATSVATVMAARSARVREGRRSTAADLD